MKRILLLWHTQNNNFGDVLIYETVRTFLVNCGMKTAYLDVGVSCDEIFNEANKYDFLLFAGGGIIERYIPEVIRKFKANYNKLCVPYGVIGLSVGNFDYSRYREELEFWIANSSFFYTRDLYTASKLKFLCNTNKIQEGVDVVWANNRICMKDVKRHQLKGINVRDVPYIDIQGDIHWENLKKIIKKLEISHEICDESQKSEEVNLLDSKQAVPYSVNTTLEQIWNCRIIVAMRYHVILVAAANGIPVISIKYCQKIEELTKQIKLECYAVNIDEIDKIEKKFYALQQCIEEENIRLKELYLKMKKEAEKMLETVGKIINDVEGKSYE